MADLVCDDGAGICAECGDALMERVRLLATDDSQFFCEPCEQRYMAHFAACQHVWQMAPGDIAAELANMGLRGRMCSRCSMGDILDDA